MEIRNGFIGNVKPTINIDRRYDSFFSPPPACRGGDPELTQPLVQTGQLWRVLILHRNDPLFCCAEVNLGFLSSAYTL